MKVIRPVTRRKMGLPRPVSLPSSDRPSEKAMEIPAPTAEAAPMRKTVRELCVAKAVAKMGARVETEDAQDKVFVAAEDGVEFGEVGDIVRH